MELSACSRWWYGPGWRRAMLMVRATAHNLLDWFSLPILLQTLFAPWKKDIHSSRGLGLQPMLQVLLMNGIARLVGAVVRSVLIVSGLLIAGVVYLVGGILLVGWLGFPLVVGYLVIQGVWLVFK